MSSVTCSNGGCSPYADTARSIGNPSRPEQLQDIDPTDFRAVALWRVFAWAASTGGEAWFLYHHSPVQSFWLNLACWVVIGVINALIVMKPVELYRSVEVRPDCMIIEGAEIFWLSHMENGWPTFQPDEEGNQKLSGIYGSRFVEYLTVRRFDELDRMPEVFGAHLQDAMQQLWGRAQEFQ
jgi:hypothetical protein